MMSEDDTFRRLKRTPKEEVLNLLDEYLFLCHQNHTDMPIEKKINKFLESHGWTWEERSEDEDDEILQNYETPLPTEAELIAAEHDVSIKK